MMKIDNNMLHIPPHISVSWIHIRSLHVKGNQLIVTLIDGDSIAIPGLPQETYEKIFSTHAEFLDQEMSAQQQLADTFVNLPPSPSSPDFFNPHEAGQDPSFQIAFGSLDNFNAAMQHNPAQSNTPELPAEMLSKIASIAKIVSSEDAGPFPKAEPHCNCTHCQIARAIHQTEKPKSEGQNKEEVVSDTDLQFQQWDIKQTGDKLFSVTNRLDTIEQYNVFLGEPVGCTCGKERCDHVIAVLKS